MFVSIYRTIKLKSAEMASSSEERDDFEAKSEPGSDVDMKSESSDGDVEFVQWLKTSAVEEEVKFEPGRQLSFEKAPWLLFEQFEMKRFFKILLYKCTCYTGK